MYCKNCGNPHAPGQKYCSVCGAPLAQKAKLRDRTWSSLLLIPAVLLADLLIFYGAALADNAIFAGSEVTVGHPAPVITLLVILPLCLMTLSVTVFAVIRTVKKLRGGKHR